MTTPLEHMPPVNQRKATVMGYPLRAVKALPVPLRDQILTRLLKTEGPLAPFPETLRMLEVAGGIPSPATWQGPLLAARPQLREVVTREIYADNADGQVRARLYLPPAGVARKDAAFVWVHGGAFLLGGLEQEEAHWPSLELAATGIPVLSVDYRMSLNGVRYPVPHQDVLAGWRWAVRNADQLGVSPGQLHLGGASAGGCLAAGVALRLRDLNDAQPASLVLEYPVVQPTLAPPSAEVAASLATSPKPIVNDVWVEAMFQNWAGPAPLDAYVAPGLANLGGLPPTYVLSCGWDSLRRASEPFAERLRDAGVPVWHDLLEGTYHAPLDRPGAPDGIKALARLQTWLNGGVNAMEAGKALNIDPLNGALTETTLPS
ncbi:alpha/beta hydrolase [Deinococcus alpinitundrae]|uniref:alpha/beta hydrolase n=1 Tax=Deinococcus alpinitundrae TaxID=468913 RepID=UPI001379BB4D|nr:alpha/beta hydrolase fold domain-containing protein [Deinococcus alpinitundrae]